MSTCILRKSKMKARMLLPTIIALSIVSTYAGAAPNKNQGGVTQPAMGELSEAEIASILHMREEEKLARDVYLTLGKLWDCPVFANIAASEQRHMDAVGRLILKYGLEDPIVHNTVGVFSATRFAELYATLVETGSVSLLEALGVGVQIETLDIEDLDKALDTTETGDVKWVFENLRRGSHNHLNAFTRNIASGGTNCSTQRHYRRATGIRRADNLACQGCRRGGRGTGNGQGNRSGRRRNGNRNNNCSGSGQFDQDCRRDAGCQLQITRTVQTTYLGDCDVSGGSKS
jgi:hypothetical protein